MHFLMYYYFLTALAFELFYAYAVTLLFMQKAIFT